MTSPDRIRCEEVISHLLEYLDGEIDDEQRRQIDRHLEECRGCFSYAEFEMELKKRIKEVGTQEPPPSLKQRIEELIALF